MASCITSMWSGSVCPQVRLTVTQQSSNDTSVTMAYKLEYVAHGYSANTNGNGRAYTIKIDGASVRTGTYNINGISGTKTITTGTKVVSKTHASRNVSFSVTFNFDITWSGTYGGEKSASGSISIGAKTAYTISYNLNGGSGTFNNQTQYHGESVTLHRESPEKTGHSFQGWGTSTSDTSKDYDPGKAYTFNANKILYAVWKADTYSITYYANGGSGAPPTQTKTYGQTLPLSDIEPTRPNYDFVGWGTSASDTTKDYDPGGSYTKNEAEDLYAIWKLAYTRPRITNYYAIRCDENGVPSDDGTCLKVNFSWATDKEVSEIFVDYSDTHGNYTTEYMDGSGTVGTVTDHIIHAEMDPEYSYEIRIVVRDSMTGVPTSFSDVVITIPAHSFAIDVTQLATDGRVEYGVAIGKPANTSGLFDVGLHAKFGKTVTSSHGEEGTESWYTAERTDSAQSISFGIGSGGQNRGVWARNIHTMSSGNNLSNGWLMYAGEDGYVKSQIAQKILWSGSWYMTTGHTATLSETIDKQLTGIVLVWSCYEGGTVIDDDWHIFFIPKQMIAMHNSFGYGMEMTRYMFDRFGYKYVKVYNDKIVGSEFNNIQGTGASGISYNTGAFVLRYVIGV